MSCSTSIVITDYDAAINFNDFKTYRFYEDLGKGLNELDVKRVTTIMNTELKQLGFNEVETPDFYINVISKLSEAQNNNTIGITYVFRVSDFHFIFFMIVRFPKFIKNSPSYNYVFYESSVRRGLFWTQENNPENIKISEFTNHIYVL